MYSVYLPYGEGDVVISNSAEVYLPNDENVLLVSVCGYEYAETYADSIYYKNSDGLRDGGMLSRNGDMKMTVHMFRSGLSVKIMAAMLNGYRKPKQLILLLREYQYHW